MTLRTFYAYDHEAPDEPDPQPEPVDDRHSIKWGYNLADLGQLARMAVHRCFAKGGSAHDRYQAAWSGIAEALVNADEAPSKAELIHAGWAAVSAHTTAEMQQHGKSRTTLEQHTGFERYWQARPTASPENRIVERMALWEIIPKLSPRQWEAVKALAAAEDYALAAQSMGLSTPSFNTQIRQARARFFQWWHEGETPPRRRRDRRVYSRDGAFAGKARLTVSQVEAARDRYAAGESTLTAIAAEHGVSGPTLSALIRGRTKPAPDLPARPTDTRTTTQED